MCWRSFSVDAVGDLKEAQAVLHHHETLSSEGTEAAIRHVCTCEMFLIKYGRPKTSPKKREKPPDVRQIPPEVSFRGAASLQLQCAE